MKNKKYIRSSKVSLKFLNKNKYAQVKEIVLEYNCLLNEFIQFYWAQDLEKLPKFCPAKDYKQISSDILNNNLKQSCGKQALAIVRGTFQKQNKRIFKYNQLIKENQFRQAAKLKEKINSVNITCPTLDKIVPIQLNEKNCAIFLDKPNSFDGWVQKANRKGKMFECRSCGFTTDADFNASCNIALPLVPIGTEVRLAHSNKDGFYWNELGRESVVPDKPKKSKHYLLGSFATVEFS